MSHMSHIFIKQRIKSLTRLCPERYGQLQFITYYYNPTLIAKCVFLQSVQVIITAYLYFCYFISMNRFLQIPIIFVIFKMLMNVRA